ncbi:MAG: alpha/beta hydrolase [Candidatus Peregrinibacteria bacterium]
MKYFTTQYFLKIIKVIGAVLFLGYVLLCGFMFFEQKDFIFFPTKTVAEIPKNMNISEVSFLTADGIALNGWYLDNHSEKTVLFFHGNARNISALQDRLQLFQELKVNALVFDYRGYGKSGGKIAAEQDLSTDANAALKYLQVEKNISLPNIILWGHSLGGAVAIDTAQNKDVFAVIVESSFSSLDDMARKNFWYLPTPFILHFHFQSIEKISNISSPILIVHSKDDEMIPFPQSEALFKAAKSPKQFLEISGSHNNGFTDSYSVYFPAVQKFFLSHALPH